MDNSLSWIICYQPIKLGVLLPMDYSRTARDSEREVLLDAAGTTDEERHPIAQRQFASYAPNVAYIRKQPGDYRIGAILSTIFCFLPLGIFALYFSCQTRSAYDRGNLSESQMASGRAKLLIQLAVITGCILWFSGILAIIYFSSKPF